MKEKDATWTLESLKEYVDMRLEEAKNAVFLAHKANDARLDLLNEFRAQMGDREVTFAKIDALNSVEDKVDTVLSDHVQRRELDELKENQAKSAGRRSVTMILATAAVSIGIVTTGYFIADRANLNNKIHDLEVTQQRHELQDIKFEQQIQRLQEQNKFFCNTRAKAGLPSC